MKLRTFISVLPGALCAALLAASCSKDPTPPGPSDTRKVFILYSAGYNNMSMYLCEDMEILTASDIPYEDERDNYCALVFSHQTDDYYDFETPTQPALVELYRTRDETIVRDTLVRYPASTISSSSQTLREVLTYIKDNYPAREYGMLFSSHATGWLPRGYYSTGDPVTKTIGAQFTESSYTDYEIELADFAEAIPMHLKYLLLDCCLSGGVEVAWQLRDVTDYIAASQTEIMASGFVYEGIMSHIRKEPTDVRGICEDVYNYYDESPGPMRSCTISMIGTAGLSSLAGVCSSLFEKYRSQIAAVDPSTVQHYFRIDRHWFYDLKDILVQSGISTSDERTLQDALDGCVLYHSNTPYFMNNIPLVSCCGLSMYLPCNGSEYLDNFYKTLDWNKATALVK